MRVREVMTSPVITVTPDTGFKEIVEAMLEHDISGLPVVDAAGTLLGIVTEADLVSKDAYGRRRRRPLRMLAEYLRGHDPQWVRKASGLTARQLRTAAPMAVGPGDPIGVASRALLERGRKRLPVVDDDGRLVGIVARADLLRPYLRADEEVLADVERMLADPLRCPEDHRVRASVTRGVVRLEGTVRWPSDAQVMSTMASAIPGVVDVAVLLTAREAEPSLGYPLVPPLA